MAESLFDIFGDHTRQTMMRSISRQPFSNIENMGKMVSSGPIKPNEPKKAGECKKSFLSNTGKALQGTPARKVFTPRAANMASMIYTDDSCDDKAVCMEELEFHRPSYKFEHKDTFDFPEPEILKQASPPNTPPPAIRKHSMELDCSYQDEFYTDDFSIGSIPEEDLLLPTLY